MLHDRMNILLQYVSAVINSKFGLLGCKFRFPRLKRFIDLILHTQRRHMSTTHY
jgi:hypothetical protein